MSRCPDCARFARILREIPDALDEVGAWAPDALFTAEVLAATTGSRATRTGAGGPRPVGTGWLARALRRPRSPLEAAYLASMLVMGTGGVPALRELPEGILSALRLQERIVEEGAASSRALAGWDPVSSLRGLLRGKGPTDGEGLQEGDGADPGPGSRRDGRPSEEPEGGSVRRGR
jgi:hypothetical protein